MSTVDKKYFIVIQNDIVSIMQAKTKKNFKKTSINFLAIKILSN